MYFQLEVNERLANAMRAAAEVRTEIGKIIEEESHIKDRLIMNELNDANDRIGDIIIQLGGFMGTLLADAAFVESDNEVKAYQEALNEKQIK